MRCLGIGNGRADCTDWMLGMTRRLLDVVRLIDRGGRVKGAQVNTGRLCEG